MAHRDQYGYGADPARMAGPPDAPVDEAQQVRYMGLSREAASREAARLVAEAHASGQWESLIEPLRQLREVRQRG